MDYALAWGIVAFMLGVSFVAGKLASRVEHLEAWRTEVREMHAENIERFDRLEAEIRTLGERRGATRSS